MTLRAAIAARTRDMLSLADPSEPPALLDLLRLLYRTGREDLPLGRLFEGHVDALQIVSRYATDHQRAILTDAAAGGAAFGVWNADLTGEPLRIEEARLFGGKSFASGAGILSHALVTLDVEGGRQLVLLDLARTPPAIDRSFWSVVGMQRSETHIVRWDGAAIAPDHLIGAPGDYLREPWFSGGALRFAAVQAGGIAALVDHVRDHLVGTGRAGDPHQAGRLAQLYALAESAAGAVRSAAEEWFGADDARLPLVSAARAAVYEAGGQALGLAQEAVGVQSLFKRHPLATTITDLAVYLRQPGPDAQRMRIRRGGSRGRAARIVMSLRTGKPRCLLVIAPHADDETIGAFGLMTRLRRRGVGVRVLVVTDGHASHPSSRTWPRARLVRERRMETRRAVGRIGIPAGSIAFMGLPDGRLSEVEQAVRHGIARAIRRMPKPVLVVAPATSDDHADHRATAAAVAAARVAGVRYLAYPVWPAGAKLCGVRGLALSAQERLAKRHAIRSYRTQAGRITDDPQGFAMTRAQIAAFSRPVEPFSERHR